MAALPPNMQTSLAAWFRGTAFPAAPTTLYVALFSVVPTGDSGGTEMSGGGYARKSITVVTDLIADGTGRTKNATALSFAVASGTIGDVVGAALMSALTGGTRHALGSLDPSRVINTGDTLTIPVGALILDFTAA